MKRTQINLDADTRAEWQSLKIAAKKARKLAEQMGTPFYVMKSGKIVDLNASRTRNRRRHRAVMR